MADDKHAAFLHVFNRAGFFAGTHAAAGFEVDDDVPVAIPTQLQGGGLHAVFGGQPAEHQGGGAAAVQPFNQAGADVFGHVVKAGAVGVGVLLEADVDEVVVVVGVGQLRQGLEAAAADHGMAHPMFGAFQRQQFVLLLDVPCGMRDVGVFGEYAVIGPFCLTVEVWHDRQGIFNRQLFRAEL